ncbi:MAG: hypothetical protein FWE03_03085 [Firmicutes bacterium]|nr:hypothetical protein [Bacillota bacterium]
MYRLSEFIGKEAIILSNGQSAGTVSNVFFDARLKYFKFIELIIDDEEDRKMAAFKVITSFSGEAAVIRSNANLIDAVYDGVVGCPMNLSCFNQDGKNMGVIRDIVMQDNKIELFITDMMDIEASTLLIASDDLLIFNDTGQHIKRPPNKKIERIKKTAAIKKHKIAPLMIEENIDNNEIIVNESINENIDEYYQSQNTFDDIKQISTPEKIDLSRTHVHRSPILTSTKNKYEFLIGMHLIKDIYNNSGQLILAKNTTITQTQIDIAKTHDRLVSMTLNCI